VVRSGWFGSSIGADISVFTKDRLFYCLAWLLIMVSRIQAIFPITINVSQPAAKSSASTAQIDRGKIEDLSLGPNGTINRAVESKKN
jgi:hypothetical protein